LSPRKSKPGITSDQVRQLATLSRLTLSPSEEEEMRKDISSILEYFGAVDSVKEEVPLDKAALDANSLRADEVRPSDPEGVLGGVPQKKGRLVKAPRVF
jgi:aspartyl/glutamyl-tRNA(Asn/Gln) amidotransferase C subunit